MEELIKFTFHNQLANAETPADADYLFRLAVSYPHKSTKLKCAFQGYFLDEHFCVAVAPHKVLMRAIEESTGLPKVIKFYAEYDFDVFRQLGLNENDAKKNHLVFLQSFVIDSVPAQGIFLSIVVMPAYICSLHDIRPYIIEEVAVAHMDEIKTALDYMHSKGVFHCDVKPENIFVDTDGAWYLGDYGSGCKERVVSLSFSAYHCTVGYLPREVRVKLDQGSKQLDYCMLVTAIIFKLKDPLLKFGGFTIKDLKNRISNLSPPLREMLTALLKEVGL